MVAWALRGSFQKPGSVARASRLRASASREERSKPHHDPGDVIGQAGEAFSQLFHGGSP